MPLPFIKSAVSQHISSFSQVYNRTKPHMNIGTIGHVDHGLQTWFLREGANEDKGFTMFAWSVYASWRTELPSNLMLPTSVEADYRIHSATLFTT